MFVPVLLDELDAVSPLVLEMERTIISEEGRWHVNGAYFRDDSVAATNRRREAEKRVRKALREAARLSLPECSYCFHQVVPGEATVMYAGKRIHEACAHEFHSWAHGPTQRELDSMSLANGISRKEAA